MAKQHLEMLDTVNPYYYWGLTTFMLVIYRLTWVLFRLTGPLFRLTVVPFCHFTISCFKHTLSDVYKCSQLILWCHWCLIQNGGLTLLSGPRVVYCKLYLDLYLSITITNIIFWLIIKLEVWWEDVAYLASRYPTVPLTNIGGPFPITDMWPVQNGTQIKRAAVFTHAFLLIWQRLYRYVL